MQTSLLLDSRRSSAYKTSSYFSRTHANIYMYIHVVQNLN